jgi:hypothetical protein
MEGKHFKFASLVWLTSFIAYVGIGSVAEMIYLENGHLVYDGV